MTRHHRLTIAPEPTPEEIEIAIRRAHILRAEVTAAGITRLVAAVRAGFRRLIGGRAPASAAVSTSPGGTAGRRPEGIAAPARPVATGPDAATWPREAA